MISTLHYSGQAPRGNETFCCNRLLLLDENKGQARRMYRSGNLIDAHCLSMQPYSWEEPPCLTLLRRKNTIHFLISSPQCNFNTSISLSGLLNKNRLTLPVLFSPMETNVMAAKYIKYTRQYVKNALHLLCAFPI